MEQLQGGGGASGLRPDGSYTVSAADRAAFQEQGYVHLPGVLSEEEMSAVVDPVCAAVCRQHLTAARRWRRAVREGRRAQSLLLPPFAGVPNVPGPQDRGAWQGPVRHER